SSRPGSAAREIERYAALFAGRTRVMKSSAMRDLMALTERPDVISLAGGWPDTSTFPPDSYAALMSTVASQSCARALQYGPTEGLSDVREAIALVMEAEGMRVDPDAILPTSGGQQALDLVCKILIDRGDVIVAEAPTYPGAVPTFCSYEADVIQIPMDRDGMRIELLREALARLDREGRRPKFIYTIPNFHNPAGVTLSLERRRELLQIAGERELLVLEDNPYGLLRYEGEPIPALYSLDADFVLYTGTFSKILSPGVRIGWLVAPPPVLRQLALGKGSADLCSSSISQYFIAEYFRAGPWLDYVRSLSERYRRRRDVMLDAMAEHFPREASWTHPAGGLFVWATMPDYIDTTDLLARAVEEEQVAFVPGRAAFVDGRGGSAMRLNFSGVGEDEIREGIRRLGEVIREQVALYSTLTGQYPAPAAARAAVGSAPAGSGPADPDPAQAGTDRAPLPTEPATAADPLDNVRHLSHKRAG
ncbi:MAG: PLP-dependent aminotransferase family protein, partial [Acidobacteriota bacterium]|nr:PLP-dependent aminotransferase family protein [Acidobacteriota bacterium]